MARKRRTSKPVNLAGFGKLAAYLIRHGLSQDAFAKKAGLDRITVLRLVRGDRRWMTCDCAGRIEAATDGEVLVVDFMSDAVRRSLVSMRRRAA